AGVLRDDTVRARHSVHGPVVASKAGKAIALRAVGMGGSALPFAFQQWWEMGRAKSLAEFDRAIRPNQISGQNITYADRDGHIMVFYGGNTPVRADGDRAFWGGIIPGESSATLWTKLHGFSDMPKTLDPAVGWVQNANDPPWWSTFPVAVRAQDFPSYFGPRQMALRPQRSVRMLQADSSITFAELVQYKHSTRMELADRVLDDLLPAVRASGTGRARRAADVLDRWDRSADATSRGAELFVRWWAEYGRRMGGRTAWAAPWSEERPLDTPDGISDATVAVAALDSAAVIVERMHGALDVPWGDVYRVRRDSVDLPGNGASGNLGVFRVTGFEPAGGNQGRAAAGDSYVAAIEFASPVRAMSIVAYGNASRRGSPHRTDQLGLFSRKELKPVWRTRADVEAHLEARERFQGAKSP
ncbi:MAG: penicillin acylase family protein, partial [Gemmatimonadaceae bacterium]